MAITVGAMDFHRYTPDAICEALGLPSFQESGEGRRLPWLRLLLLPSFHPELCITFVPGDAETVAEVRSFNGQLWSAVTTPPSQCERVSIEADGILQFTETFEHAVLEASKENKRVCLDGMRVHAMLETSEGIREIEGNVGVRPALGELVRTVAQQIHPRLPRGFCRNALAQAAGYADLQLSLDLTPNPPSATRIMVLGDPEGTEEVMRGLFERRKRD